MATNGPVPVFFRALREFLMRTLLLAAIAILAVAVCSGRAADSDKPKNSPTPASASAEQPDFIAGWRVSGVVKQGERVQASLEKTGRAARYVSEGDELTTGVVVEKIDPANRTVTVRHDKQTAVIRPGSAPVPVKPNTALAQAQPTSGQQSRPAGPWGGGPPWSGGAGTAGQDPQGRWGIRFGNGGFFSAQDYATRFGGTEQAVAHINQRMSEQIDPNRRAFYQQMLTALQNSSGAAAPAAGVQSAP